MQEYQDTVRSCDNAKLIKEQGKAVTDSKLMKILFWSDVSGKGFEECQSAKSQPFIVSFADTYGSIKSS